jgi:hypothetical protein
MWPASAGRQVTAMMDFRKVKSLKQNFAEIESDENV